MAAAARRRVVRERGERSEATTRTTVDSSATIGPAPRATRLPETELGATQLYPRRIGQVTALVGRAAVLGEMFGGSSRVKKNFAATDPVRRAREASGLCAALCFFSSRVPLKNPRFYER